MRIVLQCVAISTQTFIYMYTVSDCDLTKQFRCGHSMSCFSNTKLCDGVIDCWDGYDEMNCTAGIFNLFVFPSV